MGDLFIRFVHQILFSLTFQCFESVVNVIEYCLVCSLNYVQGFLQKITTRPEKDCGCTGPCIYCSTWWRCEKVNVVSHPISY
uniref:Uncharacterized protein n=1 Tax=Triticum urartu TaxID=4572 RepID=A0A8R7PNS4_TRIUA